MTEPKPPPAPLDLDSFLTAVEAPQALAVPAAIDLAVPPPAPAAPKAPAATLAIEATFPLLPLPAGAVPPAYAKSIDPTGPAANRMMAARAMVPIPPAALVPIIYQLIMDPEPKIAAAAFKTFRSLDEKLVGPALTDALPPQVLEALAHVLVARFELLERVLLIKSTPDSAFVWLAQHAEDAKVINVVVENQQRIMRTNDIVRGLKKNPKVLRSDLDKAIDFMVREGVFLDDVQEFEDAFLRLGKAEMLTVLKNVRVTEEHLSERERQKAKELGMSADDFMMSGSESLTDEEREAMLDELVADEGEGVVETDFSKMPFMKLPIPIQIKMAMTGPHDKAIEGLNSSNRVVAGSAIRNPKIKENDVIKISRSKTMHEDVIRYICNNGDWTKSYVIKLSLIQNPKTPPTLVSRWLPLMRASDLKGLSKSKQVPSNVQMMAKRLLGAREP